MLSSVSMCFGDVFQLEVSNTRCKSHCRDENCIRQFLLGKLEHSKHSIFGYCVLGSVLFSI